MMHHKSTARLAVLFGIVIVLLGCIGWRVFDLSYRRHTWYQEASTAQTSGASNVLVRGSVELREQDGTPVVVATNKKFPILIVNTSRLNKDSFGELASRLASIVKGDAHNFEEQFHQSGSRVLARRLSEDQVNAIKQLNIAGISVGYETDRVYPAGMLAAEALGFLGYGERGRVGQYGLEAFYDNELTGMPTTQNSVPGSTTVKRWFGRAQESPSPSALRPHDLVLSIDKSVQSYAHEVLADVVNERQATSGVLIVQEPQTGRIIALADLPTFDPNSYRDAPVASFMNSALQAFEPGSSLKPFTMAAGLEARAITPETTFNDEGNTTIDGYTIKNFNEKNFGIVTMTQVLKSPSTQGLCGFSKKLVIRCFVICWLHWDLDSELR
jgi:cell division protein FtsI/penicillin-binding protein 2